MLGPEVAVVLLGLLVIEMGSIALSQWKMSKLRQMEYDSKYRP